MYISNKKAYLIGFLVMLATMIAFVSYALTHPNASMKIPVQILWAAYLAYIAILIWTFIKFITTKEEE